VRGQGDGPRDRQRVAVRGNHVAPSAWGGVAVRGAALGGAGGPCRLPPPPSAIGGKVVL